SVSWLFSMPVIYLLGIHMGYGLIGIWSAFIIDEWMRGIILYLRWRSRAWQKKSLLELDEREPAVRAADA
ncbi:MATE family efflux transporter, partial [Paenibacillus sepulcri]|nr:MATE family efflux transporter [Paenibacillus sepulcri]